MAAAARRVEDLQIAWIFLRPVGYVQRLRLPLLVAQILLRCSVPGWLVSQVEEDLPRPIDQIAALLLELGAAPAHLVPGTAQRIVCQELDHVAWGEELVPYCQFAAVA